tara:strand:- start:858 stop:1010 length:153 start_codon:yes stop_codon:yes gene_type:complete
VTRPLANSKKYPKEKPWVCFDKKPTFLKGMKKIPLSEVLANISDREQSKN